MKKITLFTIMVVLLLSGAIYSCNGFEDFDFNESTALTDEAQTLKELYQAEIPKLGELIETRAESSLTDEENRRFLTSFSSQTVSMLKSYGFTEKDWEEFESTQDPAFILSGMLFLAVMDTNNEEVSFSFLKTRAMEEGEEDDSCYDPYKAIDCLRFATGIDDWLDLMSMGCLTQTLLLTACKSTAGAIVGAAALAYVMWEFSQCMGWI